MLSRRFSGWVCLCILLLITPLASAGQFAESVAVDHLEQGPANDCDLSNKTLRFTPAGDGKYHVQVADGATLLPTAQRLHQQKAIGVWYNQSWAVPLSFTFHYGGKDWKQVFVNQWGNLTFDKCEGDLWPERDPWPDGTMTSVAAVLDSRSAAGMECMIAPFWSPAGNPTPSQISMATTRDCLAVTWNTTRDPGGLPVAGPNHFQARLFASGVIELAYGHLSERDAIVGLFQGVPSAQATSLVHWQPTQAATDPLVDVDSADAFDRGTVIDFAITMKDTVSPTPGNLLNFATRLWHDSMDEYVSLHLGETTPSVTNTTSPTPQTCGWRINGKRVDLFISKSPLVWWGQTTVAWNVVLPDKKLGARSGRKLTPIDMSQVKPGTIDLTAPPKGPIDGNIFEVFHYPIISRSGDQLLAQVYGQKPSPDDFAIVFTDERADDLFGVGCGVTTAQQPIAGIGPNAAGKPRLPYCKSDHLQISITPCWIGATKLQASGVDGDLHWNNYADGTSYILHEMTHRWGMQLRFTNPETQTDEPLFGSGCHWRAELNTPAVFPLSPLFTETHGNGPSVMGGSIWQKQTNGICTQQPVSGRIPYGFSALDLYAMGMLPPEKVPPTFLLEDTGDGPKSHAVQVKIEDIIKAIGPRQPSFADSQKRFSLKFYVLHPREREVAPEMLQRAEHLAENVADAFHKGTGGVMTVVPTGDPSPAK